MKLMKLFTHQLKFGGGGYTQDLVISSKDIPGLKVGDIVEIYHPEDEFSRLLIQVVALKEELQHRDAISLEQTVAATFLLRVLSQVCVNIVKPSDVALDLIELTFKDYYVGRSEMWRLSKNLVGSVAYLNKKIEFCQLVRCQVHEMWSGERVAGGLITKDTRIVFRSASSMVYLFIQMSCEMWDFDIYGDLYFEKAVNGFLSDLFTRWKKQGCNHEVTIVLFSRTMYETLTIEDFPLEMRSQVTQDYKGRFYEDYYRVLVQSERSEDWHQILIQLRKAFNDYATDVVHVSQRKYGRDKVPKPSNSAASQGNFLEVLNMSLNVFERHYMDRSLDRTGQLSVVLTPGVGVFEVNRELTSITKQRIIDSGVGSDLVCVGEQPLHAVPLLRFRNRDALDAADDYNIPHWLNLSFYSSNKKLGYSNFVPRIRTPAVIAVKETPKLQKSQSAKVHSNHETDSLNQLFDYDAYDTQVFQLPTLVGQRKSNLKARFGTLVEGRTGSLPPSSKMGKANQRDIPVFKGRDEYVSTSHAPTLFLAKDCSARSHDSDDLSGLRTVVGSEGSPLERQLAYRPKSRPGRALINPFDPSRVPMKHTSGRRRWTHIYPKQTSLTGSTNTGSGGVLTSDWHVRQGLLGNPNVAIPSSLGGEEIWSAAISTGVDWKSLTIPACLPITTDYFPDSTSLRKDYVVSDYSISPDDVNVDYNQSNKSFAHKTLKTSQVYKEFISQRLAQGFQLIVLPPTTKTPIGTAPLDTKSQSPGPTGSASSIIRSTTQVDQVQEESFLSIGLIFHRITLRGSTITVTGYKPRHPSASLKCTYVYNLRTALLEGYHLSRTDFVTEKLQNYNWNHMDHYICTGGNPDFALTEPLKYWRLRLCFIPLSHAKKYSQGPPSPSATEEKTFEGFTRIIENSLNRMRQRHRKRSQQALPLDRNERTMTGVSKSEKPNRLRAYSVRGKLDKGHLKIDGRDSPSSEVESTSSMDSLNQESSNDSIKRITPETHLGEVAELLKSSLSFVEKGHDQLPPLTFVSHEALCFLIDYHCLSKDEAKDILQKLLSEGIICHASGSKSVSEFVVGFHLYFFPNVSSPVKGKERSVALTTVGDLALFEQDCVEVAFERPCDTDSIDHANGFKEKDDERLLELAKRYRSELQKLSIFKEAYIDVDVCSRSDRKEWGHLNYPSFFTPDCAYVTVLKWVEATGAIIFDLVLGWLRKAQPNGFLLVPMPTDPLFATSSPRSDPFRTPMPIPLNTKVLGRFLDKYPDKSNLQRAWLLHDAIARYFSFMPCVFENSSSRRSQLQYIHSSGLVFLVVPKIPEVESGTVLRRQPSAFSIREESPLTFRNCDFPVSRIKGALPVLEREGVEIPAGFLWCSNYLFTKRWRAPSGDETTHSKLMLDLLDFCQDETRLGDFTCCDSL